MPKRQFCFGLAAMAVFATSLAAVLAAHDGHTHAKHSIKQVMKEANKGADGEKSLLQRVTAGGASDADKKLLLDYYISLVESKPEKGDMQSWQTLAGKAVTAAAKVAVGREGAEEELKASTNCKACHSKHK